MIVGSEKSRSDGRRLSTPLGYVESAPQWLDIAMGRERGFSIARSRYSAWPQEPTQTTDAARDNATKQSDTGAMNDITREELRSTLSAIEERMDKRIDRMEHDAEKRVLDYKSELELRDEQVRREVDLRQESFRFEQAARDAALSEKFSGFLAAQAERDKAWEKISEARFERIEKDVSSIKADTKKVSDDVNGIRVTMAKYLGAAIVIGALASAALGAAAKHILG
ncbi:hypothetical protein [Pseudomonas sp. Irchel 3A18]|uniref:hypothetical protein n=1 Tax=Pseudomonas sp. Irchel 3A18 TaxID=2008905 RepID=UPI001179981C|nr:hypothetical protein [Pseudomonas sp. Irchel 3A18]